MSSLEILRNKSKEQTQSRTDAPVFFDLTNEQERSAAVTELYRVTFAKRTYVSMLGSENDSSIDELAAQISEVGLDDFLLLQALQLGVLHDDYRSQLRELFRLNTDHRGKSPAEIEAAVEQSGRDSLQDGTLVYFPDSQTFHHILQEDEYWQVYTARNYPIVDKDTQQKLRDLHVCIAGSSVGGRVALALAAMGVGKITIVDAGEVSTEKMAMGGYTLDDLATPKATTIQAQIQHLNPYIDMQATVDLVTQENIVDLFGSADVIIQSVDDLQAKILIAHFGKSIAVPVLAPTDLGLGTVVEHIDRPPFNDKLTMEKLREAFQKLAGLSSADQYRGFVELAKRIIGSDLIPLYVSEAVEQLADEGLFYLPQPAISAQIMAGVTVNMIITWLQTGEMPQLKQYDPSLD